MYRLVCTVLAWLSFISLTFSQQREDQLINFDWKFIQQPVEGAELFSFEDTDWQIVDMPHDASIYGPFLKDSLNSDRKNGFRPRLEGWYRKSVDLSPETGRKYFLHFEGIYRDARIYVNEELLAHQLNGFEEFEVDITPHIRPGKNLFAVHYNNKDIESSRWYNGEGIYRDVWLQERSEVYIPMNGTFVRTTTVSSSSANITMVTEVKNAREQVREVMLESMISGPDGEIVTTEKSIVPIASGERYVFNQRAVLESPELWGLENPKLYTLKSVVSVEGKVMDVLETTFGIRTVSFDPNQGMLLNGKKVLAKGVNIHHDLGPLGAAAFERGFERRLEGLKKLGCNAIRLAHNPHDEFILDWCDRNGMLVVDEAFDKWDDQFFGNGNSFEAHWKSSLRSFIRRDRNHPSVILWSVGNETRQQRDPAANFGIDMMKEMADFVHQLDPGRLVTCGLHPSRESGAYRTENYYREGPPEMEFYMDVVSTNYREEFWPVDRANYPQLIFILSEAQVGNFGNEWFNFDHEKSVGLFYWGGTDYLGESFGWPAKGWPNGLIDWNDHWKPFSYYIHSLFSDKPMVYVAAYDSSEETEKYWNEVNLRYQPLFSHWNWEGKDSVTLITFSNAQEVELFINDQSAGIKKVPSEYFNKKIKGYTAAEFNPEDPLLLGPELHKRLEWRVPFTPGNVKAQARTDGKVVAEYELVTTGKAARIRLVPDRSEIDASGLDLSYITVEVVDDEGNVVPDADHLITFMIEGAGINAGVSNADVLSNEPFQSDQRRVFQGRALLVVRGKRNPGTIMVKANARQLKSAKTKIEVISSGDGNE